VSLSEISASYAEKSLVLIEKDCEGFIYRKLTSCGGLTIAIWVPCAEYLETPALAELKD